MADYCTKCYKEMFGEGKPDIDVLEIFNNIQKDHIRYCICEGCELSAIANIDGAMKVTRDFNFDIAPKNYEWYSYDEYWNKYNQVTPEGRDNAFWNDVEERY